jgi:hypothetical protein
MQIIQDDLISATASDQSHISSTYAVGNITNDDPNLGYICNTTECVITLTVAAGMQALFLSGLQADDGTVQIVTSAGEDGYDDVSATPYSALIELALNTRQRIPPEWFNFTLTDSGLNVLPASYSGGTLTGINGSGNTLTLTGNMTLAGMLVVGLQDGENYVINNDSGSALGVTSVKISLQTTTDVKDLPVSGNAIAKWNQSSGATGRFDDSSDAVINVHDFGNIMIGSIVTIASTDYQVIKIVGDGTSATDITLSGSPSDGSITSIKHPIKLGIVRAGSILDIENPQLGASRTFTDYSIRRPLIQGGYVQTPRNISKDFSASFQMTDANTRSFEGFYYAFRSKPFACLLTQDMDTSTNAKIRNSGFFYIPQPPQISYSAHSGAISNVNATFSEVI